MESLAPRGATLAGIISPTIDEENSPERRCAGVPRLRLAGETGVSHPPARSPDGPHVPHSGISSQARTPGDGDALIMGSPPTRILAESLDSLESQREGDWVSMLLNRINSMECMTEQRIAQMHAHMLAMMQDLVASFSGRMSMASTEGVPRSAPASTVLEEVPRSAPAFPEGAPRSVPASTFSEEVPRSAPAFPEGAPRWVPASTCLEGVPCSAPAFPEGAPRWVPASRAAEDGAPAAPASRATEDGAHVAPASTVTDRTTAVPSAATASSDDDFFSRLGADFELSDINFVADAFSWQTPLRPIIFSIADELVPFAHGGDEEGFTSVLVDARPPGTRSPWWPRRRRPKWRPDNDPRCLKPDKIDGEYDGVDPTGSIFPTGRTRKTRRGMHAQHSLAAPTR